MKPKEQIRFAKYCCSEICGKKINSVVWTNWKDAVGIKAGGYQQSLTDDQFNMLCAIAYIRMQDQMLNIRTKLTLELVESKVQPARKLLEAKLKPHMRLKLEESESPKLLIAGSEISAYLEELGFKPVSLSTLRRRIHGFSINKSYSADEVLRIAN